MRSTDETDHLDAAAPGAKKKRVDVGRVLSLVTCLLVAVGFFVVRKLAGDAQPQALELNQPAEEPSTRETPPLGESGPLVLVPQTEEPGQVGGGDRLHNPRSVITDGGLLYEPVPRIRSAERPEGRRLR